METVSIEGVGVRTEDECMCANCGTDYKYSRHMYYLNNDEFVCSKACFKEYSESYFMLKKVK